MARGFVQLGRDEEQWMNVTDTSDLWWKSAVIYCLDVETFMDWNGDGIGDLDPAASEVAEWEWVDARTLLTAVDATPWAFSPWLTLQLPALYEDRALEASDQL